MNRKETKYYVMTVMIALFICLGLNSFSNQIIYTDSGVFQYVAVGTESEPDPIVDVIKEKTDVDDCITVYGNADRYYLLSERMSASKYSYQTPISIVDPSIYFAYFEDLEEINPKVIVWPAYTSTPACKMDKMYGYIHEHGYMQDEIEQRVFYLP